MRIKVNCKNIEISNDNNKICIIAGPCQLETEQHAIKIWLEKLKKLLRNLVLDLFTKLHLIKLTEQVLKGKRGMV